MKEYEVECFYCNNIIDRRKPFIPVLLKTNDERQSFRWKRVGACCPECADGRNEIVFTQE